MRKIRSSGGQIIDVLLLVDHLFASKPSFTGAKLISGNLLIFHMFPVEGKSYEEVFEQLYKIHATGVEIVISFNLGNQTKDLPKIPSAFKVLRRKNRGFDLGGFRDILQMYSLNPDSKVYFFNDSIFWGSKGLVFNYRKLVEQVADHDFVGLVESHQKVRHIQSFAFAGSEKAVLAYSGSFRNWRFKRTAVIYGELMATRNLDRNKIDWVAIYPYSFILNEFKKRDFLSSDDIQIHKLIHEGVNLNPMQHFWIEIARVGGGIVKYSAFHNSARLQNPPAVSNEVLQ
jgi:hypothetical protein